MASREQEMQKFADQIGDYIWRRKIEPKLNNYLRFFRAQVVAPAANGLISVQKPFDSTTMNLPYVSSAENLAAGDQCVVLCLGSASNSIILGNGTLSNL